LTFIKKWSEAVSSYRSSLKYAPSKKTFPLYYISVNKDTVSVKLKRSTIRRAAQYNIDELLKIQQKEIRKITYHWLQISSLQQIDVEYETQDGSEIEIPQFESHSKSNHKIKETVGQNIWHREGKVWRIIYDNKPDSFGDLKGMLYIAQLLANPGKFISAAELMESSKKKRTSSKVDIGHGIDPDLIEKYGKMSDEQLHKQQLSKGGLGSAGDITDRKAIKDVKENIRKLEKSLEIAEETRDFDRASEIREELHKLRKYLARGVSIRGKSRKDRDTDTKIVKAVDRCINTAKKNIMEENESLWLHLYNTIKRRDCRFLYAPDRTIKWDVKI